MTHPRAVTPGRRTAFPKAAAGGVRTRRPDAARPHLAPLQPSVPAPFLILFQPFLGAPPQLLNPHQFPRHQTNPNKEPALRCGLVHRPVSSPCGPHHKLAGATSARRKPKKPLSFTARRLILVHALHRRG